MSASARCLSGMWFCIPSVKAECIYFVHSKTSHRHLASMAVGAGGEGIPNTELNGHKSQRLASTANIACHRIECAALRAPLKRNCLRCERPRIGNHTIESKHYLVRRRPVNLRNVDRERLCRLKG